MKPNLRWILLAAALLVVAAGVYLNTTGPERSAARRALTSNLQTPQNATLPVTPVALPRLLQLRGGAD
jgi:hypothetical protein